MIRHIFDSLAVSIFALVLLMQACSLNGSGGGGAGNDGKWKTISASPNVEKTRGANGSDAKNATFTASLPSGFIQPSDAAGRRLMKEYGAVYVAKGGVLPPPTVVFRDEADVSKFQSACPSSRETISGVPVELQSPAMQALKDAVTDALAAGLKITPRGADAAKRTYQDTVGLWASRVEPGLSHWVSQGRLAAAEALRIKGLSPYEQVPEILKLESEGMFFSKDLSKSIIYSVAPPGSSQHLSMLALDVTEYDNQQVRSILARHGWFQTVTSDLPHFTYLGINEGETVKLGLKKVTGDGRTFWVPDI